jgi:acyl-CoA thioester hydrolase
MIEYSVETKLRIDWSDLDALGHVNHLAIMRYIQTARVLYFELLGMSSRIKGLHVGPIMASVSAQFKKQILELPRFRGGLVKPLSLEPWLVA